MSIIIDGKAVAAEVRSQIKEKCAEIVANGGKTPKLAILLVGNNPASEVYVSSKEKACAETGIESLVVRLPENSEIDEIICAVDKLCADETIDGVMVQLPLPGGIDAKPVLDRIPFEKDVDGLNSASAGRAFHGEKCLIPCTPKGIVRLLKKYEVPLAGKHAVIIGRSNLVGKPMSILLLNENCTVTICHSKTENLEAYTKSADILVVAVGKPGFVTGDMIKKGAAVIDVGISRTERGLKGDVDFDSALEAAGYITPVPGGVGPMTVAMLLENTLEALTLK